MERPTLQHPGATTQRHSRATRRDNGPEQVARHGGSRPDRRGHRCARQQGAAARPGTHTPHGRGGLKESLCPNIARQPRRALCQNSQGGYSRKDGGGCSHSFFTVFALHKHLETPTEIPRQPATTPGQHPANTRNFIIKTRQNMGRHRESAESRAGFVLHGFSFCCLSGFGAALRTLFL